MCFWAKVRRSHDSSDQSHDLDLLRGWKSEGSKDEAACTALATVGALTLWQLQSTQSGGPRLLLLAGPCSLAGCTCYCHCRPAHAHAPISRPTLLQAWRAAGRVKPAVSGPTFDTCLIWGSRSTTPLWTFHLQAHRFFIPHSACGRFLARTHSNAEAQAVEG